MVSQYKGPRDVYAKCAGFIAFPSKIRGSRLFLTMLRGIVLQYIVLLQPSRMVNTTADPGFPEYPQIRGLREARVLLVILGPNIPLYYWGVTPVFTILGGSSCVIEESPPCIHLPRQSYLETGKLGYGNTVPGAHGRGIT